MAMQTVGPQNAFEDEMKIGKGYQTWLSPILLIAPFLALRFFDPVPILVMVSGVALMLLHEIGGRLHDLCIRARRTNILLRDAAMKSEAEGDY